MRLSAFAVIAAAAALVSSAPLPIRLLILSSSVQENSPINSVRFGHAVPPLPMPESERHKGEALFRNGPIPVPVIGGVPPLPPSPPRRFRHRPGCKGMRAKAARLMRQYKLKALEIANAIRQAFGLPVIKIKCHRPHLHKGVGADNIHVEGGLVTILPHIETEGHKGGVPPPHEGHHHGHHGPPPDHDHPEHKGPPPHHHHHHGHNMPFLSRLHFSLMNLGRWEGRAVAFVIGCGIGVLLRMLWVLSVVAVRTVRGGRGPHDGYAPVSSSVMEESNNDSDDEAPPKYVYLVVDEKLVVEESK